MLLRSACGIKRNVFGADCAQAADTKYSPSTTAATAARNILTKALMPARRVLLLFGSSIRNPRRENHAKDSRRRVAARRRLADSRSRRRNDGTRRRCRLRLGRIVARALPQAGVVAGRDDP